MENQTFATIKTNQGDIKIKLYPDVAPKTCENFTTLAKKGYYNGVIFHRVIKEFMIQGGDPTGTGMGGSGNNIKGEFKINGFNNEISHKRGVISMARAQAFNSASSQFFIMHKDCKQLDGSYAAFGKVVSGMEVVDEIASIPTDFRDRPVTDMKMKKVTLI